MSRVIVTGATGFVGRHLVQDLLLDGAEVAVAVRDMTRITVLPKNVTKVAFDLERAEELDAAALKGGHCIFHLAARVHVMHSASEDTQRFDRLNTCATEILARRAAAAGIRRFVYLSSIKVNGERTLGRPFAVNDAPAPQDAYACAKLKAERKLAAVAAETGLEVVVVRPPLVYGPFVGANFARLVSLVASGLPLPLKEVANQRSMVSVWNLSSLLRRAAFHGQAPGRVWLVSDGEDVSTPQLLRLIAAALGRKARLWPMPLHMLRTVGAVIGRSAEIGRLTDSLQVDCSLTRTLLDWHPPISVEEGITRTVTWFRQRWDADG